MTKITVTIEIEKSLAQVLERDGFHDDPQAWFWKRLEAGKQMAFELNHEIRTPLTVIAGYAGIIAERGNLDAEQLEAMDRLNEAVDYIEQVLGQYFGT